MFTGRNPDGFVDHEVLVTALDDLDGNPVATLVNYACHPTIMGPDNKLITPDYPGPVRETVESIVGGTCLFLQGAAWESRTYRRIHRRYICVSQTR